MVVISYIYIEYIAEEIHLFCTKHLDDQSYSEINLMYQKPQAIELYQLKAKCHCRPENKITESKYYTYMRSNETPFLAYVKQQRCTGGAN